MAARIRRVRYCNDPSITTLRTERQRQGLTQTQVAKKIGAVAGSVSSWEVGHRSPGFADFVAWAQVLGFTVKLTLEGRNEQA